MTTDEYFDGAESAYPMELVHGMVREPPAPMYGHQAVVTQATVLLAHHVRTRGLGAVCVSPVDVVLDRERALVVQPDIVFVAAARREIIRERIWGAPDLVVEVLSPRTEARDRTVKLDWYRQYGVKECWFLIPDERAIEVVDCSRVDGETNRSAAGQVVRSSVLPDFGVVAALLFDDDGEPGRLAFPPVP